MDSPDERWLAWAAGIIDGEGCIGLYRHSSPGCGLVLRVEVVNTDPRMLLKLKAMFGGSIHQHKKSRTRWRTRYDWLVSARKAETVLLAVLPWLVVKREQAELGLASRQARGHYWRGGAFIIDHQPPDIEQQRWLDEQLRSLKRAPLGVS